MPAARKRTAAQKSRAARAVTAARGPNAVSDTLPQTVRALRQITDALQNAQQSLADMQLRLPRAEDYEPIVAPLSEFARVSPALVEALRELVQVARPLAALVDPLTSVVRRLGEDSARLGAESKPTESASPCPEALRHVDAAHEAVLEALAHLPRDSDYAPVAAQLRELATVSPSLMEWLREVPKLATPLAGSVQALRRAAADLKAARQLLGGD